MDALSCNDKQFIRLSREAGRRRAERFYKITENGLRALLTVDMSPNDFWRVMILLSICSKQPIAHKELEDYFRQFEINSLGHSNIHAYFFQSYFFDMVLDHWLQNDVCNISATQIVMECLAINRSITLQELIKKTGLKEDEILQFSKIILFQLTLSLEL